MKTGTKIAAAIAVLCVVVITLPVFILLRAEPHFVCHKVLDGALQWWMLETSNKVWYPNVNGSSSQSLALLLKYMHEKPTALQDYRYIPGLREDDPENLVLLYMRVPSRKTWHGDTHWWRTDRRWVVLNPHMSTPFEVDARGWSECGEAVSTAQFKARLQATLDYLKKQARPHWQAVIEEHLNFLHAIRE